MRNVYIVGNDFVFMVKIRLAKEDDLTKMAELGIICFPDDFKDSINKENTTKNALNWFKEKFSMPTYAKYHLAEENGEIVGYIFHQMIVLTGVVQLEQIGVHPEHRRKGIGKKLILESEKFWQKYLKEKFGKDLYKIILTTSSINDKAHNLYAKCGFRYETVLKKMYWGNDEEIWVKEF